MEYEIQNNTETTSDSPTTPSLPTVSTSKHDTTSSTDALFTSLHNYPFSNDPGFLSGLSRIFGHPGIAVTPSELSQKPDLVTSAKCFYYSRKFQSPTPIDPDTYKVWLASQPSDVPAESLGQQHPIPTPTTAPPETQEATRTTPSEPQPPYPTSFAAIVELITNNKPIPGIEEVPDTVLEPGSSKQDHARRRRKPWEKNDGDADQGVESAGQEGVVQTAASSTNVNGVEGDIKDPLQDQIERPRHEKEDGGINGSQAALGQSEGLLRLLKPDAVPDSGLIAKDRDST